MTRSSSSSSSEAEAEAEASSSDDEAEAPSKTRSADCTTRPEQTRVLSMGRLIQLPLGMPGYVTLDNLKPPPPPLPGDGTDERHLQREQTAWKAVTVPPPPPPQYSNSVPPLAVYHICRICWRPRSARYHREHPIPINGVPPPAGICRRCRVKPAEEPATVAQVVREHESNEVKLGIKCLMPDEAVTTKNEMAERRTKTLVNQLHRGDRGQSASPRRQIRYRYVDTSDTSPSDRPSNPSDKRITKTKEVIYVVDDQSGKAKVIPEVNNKKAKPTETRNAQSLCEPNPPNRDNVNNYRISISKRASSPSRIQSNSATAPLLMASPVFVPERSDAKIRRIVRDEVERYRQAERRLEAHGSGYAHGRIVPVERWTVTDKEEVTKKPWPEKDKAQLSKKLDEIGTKTSREQKRETILIQSKNQMSYKGNIPSQPAPTIRSDTASNRAVHGSIGKTKSNATEKDSPQISNWYRESCDIFNEEGELVCSKIETKNSRGTAPDRYDSVDVNDFKSPPQRDTIHKPPDQERRRPNQQRKSGLSERVEELKEVSERQERGKSNRSSRLSDNDYWYYDEPARTADRVTSWTSGSGRSNDHSERSKLEPIQYSKDEERLRNSQKGQAQYSRTRDRAADPGLQRGGKRSPPYPRKGGKPFIPMPSPRSRRSSIDSMIVNPPTGRSSRAPDGEYLYIERTVQPADRPRETQPSDEDRSSYEKTTEEYIQRRRKPEARSTTHRNSKNDSVGQNKHHSGESNHVRFSNKVDFSPTPPGSDADLSEFRNLGARRSNVPNDPTFERGEDLIAEYEHRGRLRNRVPGRSTHAPKVEPARRSGRDNGIQRGRQMDRDRTPPPNEPRRRRGSGSSEKPAQINMMRPLARALSESPSRERLREAARRQHSDGLAPYHLEEKRSASVEAEDGSKVGREDWVDPSREPLRRRKESYGQRRRR